MICPNCEVEMEKGMLVQNGTAWFPIDHPLVRYSLQVARTGLGKVLRASASLIYAYSCPQCKQITLQRE